MSRNRTKSVLVAELDLETDLSFVREDLAGTLRAGLLFSNSALDRALLIASWLRYTTVSKDVGGKRGLAQETVSEVLEAARCVHEVAEPLKSDLARFADVSHRFVKSTPPRPLSTLIAGAVLAAWDSPALTALVGGRDRIHLGTPPDDSPRPWLQFRLGFHMHWITDATQCAVAVETVAESWRESAALVKLVVKNLPLNLRTSGAGLSITDINTKGFKMGIVRTSFDKSGFCRYTATVVVRAEL